MKTALTEGGIEVRAAPHAPARATCPTCGKTVELRQRPGWHYRHVQGTTGEKQKRESGLKQIRGTSDPYIAMATITVANAVAEASEGDVLAILSLAFSKVAHMVLDRVRLAPEEVLERILERKTRIASAVTVSVETVIEMIAETPAPVFDIRARHHDCDGLYQSPWYVLLPRPLGPAQVRMLRLVLEQVEQVYVLGEVSAWDQIVRRCMEETQEKS